MRTFGCNRIRQDLEPHFVVQTFDEFSEMSAWLGQRYEDIWMQSSVTGNLPGVIVPKTRPPGGPIAG
jgi:hypothetical protein